jgi:hypothetical protein
MYAIGEKKWKCELGIVGESVVVLCVGEAGREKGRGREKNKCEREKYTKESCRYLLKERGSETKNKVKVPKKEENNS